MRLKLSNLTYLKKKMKILESKSVNTYSYTELIYKLIVEAYKKLLLSIRVIYFVTKSKTIPLEVNKKVINI